MSKELIVSVNGREKKIAIIENGKVTEFYIERGEDGQGIVGNIYKGRVMRVLPGMQSAFVDIGLERDAFLYVSDFFDEEEEFERIVVDKKKTEGADAASAARAAAEKLERSRLERERQMDTAQERAQPILEEDDEEDDAPEPELPFATQAEDELPVGVAIEEDASTESTGRQQGGRRDRNKRRRDGRENYPQQTGGAATNADQGNRRTIGTSSSSQTLPATNFADEVRAHLAARVEIETPFAAADSSFERVMDDEAAAGEGEMFKDARLQERIFDQIHAAEFDMETTAAAEVGSLLSAENSAAHNSFQRIADDDETEDVAPRSVEAVQPAVAATVAAFVDENTADSALSAETQSFERISDDEDKAVEVATMPAENETATAARNSNSGRASKSRRGGKGRKAVDETTPQATTAAEQTTTAAETVTADETATMSATTDEATTEETGAKKKSSRARATKEATTARKSPAKSKSATSGTKGGSTSRGGKAKSSEAAAEATVEGNAPDDAAAAALADNHPLADAEAGIADRPARGEFARRGGRRRNRRPGGKPEEDGGIIADGSNGHAEEVNEPIAVEAAAIEEIPALRPELRADAPPPLEVRPEPRPETRPEPRNRNSRGGRNDRGERGERNPRGSNSPVAERSEGGGSSSSDGGGGRAGGRDRRDRHTPLITDLLREGQEILVQIAKEPIAAKGARITSHIALPGRFLVYMPTVEHVGVSRKIESDGERVRLRKLIQNIRATEDVPSGGFIVRTAGIGISEEDLRDDARYLVRTWLDIRRAAEKQKAPTLTHKDLDLVQRILRDQLSDDFAAIRVDSEEEYQAIVEFINRIQPRLVTRVKLYTREEPILEAFGVQDEIDKAIKPRVWLRSGGYLVINQTEALVAIDVNTGKFVGRGGTRLEDTITRTNMEAVEEIARQIRLRDLGGIIVLDLIDMEDRRNRNRVMAALQDALRDDKSPTKVLSFNDFGLVIMTRKRVKQSLERTLCSPCQYCQGAGLVKSAQTVCYEILDESRRLARGMNGDGIKQTTLRINPEVARALRSTERDVLTEIEDYLGAVDITSDERVHQEQFDFAFI